MSIDTTFSSPSSNENTIPTTQTIYLALGSNLGDRRSNLAAALQRLREVMEIDAVSSIYETAPVGYTDQPRFFNIVCAGKTKLSPQELLGYAKDAEAFLGRQPSFRNGPRPIDIDIVFYGNEQIQDEDLTVPHPRLRERAFVLAPLAELAPELVDPVTGSTVAELYRQVKDQDVKKMTESLRISLTRDIQSGNPTVHVSLGRAGVVGIRKAVLIGDPQEQRWFNASFDLYADLDATRAGVHMSRFSESLDEVMEDIANTSWPKVELLAEHLAQTIVEKQKVLRAEVYIQTLYPLQKWTPMSGKRSQEVYGLVAQAVATQNDCKRMIGVEVEGMVACPCAQDMIHSLARVRLQEEGFEVESIEKMLNLTPLATHNQRGRATLMVGSNDTLEASDLIAIVENAMSSENYALLKRPDELYIVNKAHANPRFVEDVAREVLRAVVERYPNLPDEDFVLVRQRNEETIHKYDVEAEGWGTLGELRTEILNHQQVPNHTSREEWLGLTQKA